MLLMSVTKLRMKMKVLTMNSTGDCKEIGIETLMTTTMTMKTTGMKINGMKTNGMKTLMKTKTTTTKAPTLKDYITVNGSYFIDTP